MPEARDRKRPQSQNVPAVECDAACQRPAKSHDGAKAGGLSGAVAADQTDKLAGVDLECHAAQHRAAQDIDREVLHQQHQSAFP